MSKPIPITYVIASLQTSEAGTEGHLLRLLRGLDRNRFAPRLVVLQRSPWLEQFQEPDLPLEVLGFRSFAKWKDWSCIGRLARSFREHGTQIVELHFMDAQFAGAIAARWAGVPVVISCRRDLGHQYTTKLLTMARLTNPWVTRFLANSQQVVDVLSRRERIAVERFDIIPNGVDLHRLDGDGAHEPDPQFIESSRGKQVVALLANLRPVKNVEAFLHAAAKVIRVIPNVCFAVMGDGPSAAELRKLAAQLQMESAVCWLGSVKRPGTYLKHAQIGCLTSHAEGFSNAILEYMAAGLPVVATRVGGADEAIVDGVTGYLIAPGDGQALADFIISLLQDEPRRTRMGEAGRSRVEGHFTQDAQVRRYHDYYEQLWRMHAS